VKQLEAGFPTRRAAFKVILGWAPRHSPAAAKRFVQLRRARSRWAASSKKTLISKLVENFVYVSTTVTYDVFQVINIDTLTRTLQLVDNELLQLTPFDGFSPEVSVVLIMRHVA
jgi:hypothetical protein